MSIYKCKYLTKSLVHEWEKDFKRGHALSAIMHRLRDFNH